MLKGRASAQRDEGGIYILYIYSIHIYIVYIHTLHYIMVLMSALGFNLLEDSVEAGGYRR